MVPITGLPGVGPGIAGLIARLTGGPRVIDLLLHLPDGIVDRSYRPTLAFAEPGRIATLAVTVERIERPSRPRQPWRVQCSDGTGQLELVFFSPQQARSLVPGQGLAVSGTLEAYGNRLSMPHPDHLLPVAAGSSGEQALAAIPAFEAVWPLTAGLSNRMLGRTMRAALARLPELPEWLDPELVRRERWPGFTDALRCLHTPTSNDPEAAARARLACDELLADQLAIGQARSQARNRSGRALVGDDRLRTMALSRFGHAPTAAQSRAIAEIDADLARPTRMLRLLQGDVGSGKTLVALMAMLRAAEAGAQACLMAPTEILARQHHLTLGKLSPVPVGLITGSLKGAARRTTRRMLESGDIPLAVGTHALFQEGVVFRDLALAIIDEQHRFGVEQRLLLGDKGAATDVLVMTATPIPRTVLLTQYGEMQVSRLDEKPAGRLPIRTTLHSLAAESEMLEAITRAVGGGAQVFWVCPLVQESEMLDLAAAQARHESLSQRFPDRVGLAHGRQDPELRHAALDAFAAGRTRILVATTVIEVGVDVPAATIMVIEHAERFGLAQLHQLRGRVGRGTAASYCLLLHDSALSASARRRLALLRDTEDGFLIADEDYRIRGGGDLMGKRQSGMPGFRLANGPDFDRLLRTAWQDAERLLQRDPDLASPRGMAARLLLELFGRADAVRTLGSG
ncbi:ATP-dependent DNA helicase RecG [Lichenicola sp.]|uniref:ATP-dependent DNA helicase RecG n=1 Tax=Lichenicola sp. TaxID=2804529 RepID=UPI003B00EAAB